MAAQHLVEQDRLGDRTDAARVVHVIGTLDRGGAETVALDLCRALPSTAFQQTFVTLGGREGRLAADFRTAGASVEQCPLDPRATFGLRLWRVLRRLRPDVVVSHVGLASGFVLMVARLAGIRGRVARLHSEGDGRGSAPRRRWRRWLLRTALRLFATDVVGVTRAALASACGPGGPGRDRRYRVLYNGVNLARLEGSERETARQALGLPRDALVLVHIGRSRPEKNRPFVGEVFRAARGLRAEARLVVAGGGGAADFGDLAADPSVLFAGERDDVGRLLGAADLLLLPSLREGLPGVVLEALACGVPVLATNLPGLREVRPLLDGLVLLELAAGPSRWAERALQLAGASPERRQEIRGRFRSSPFLLERTVARWAQLFRPRPIAPPAALPLAPALGFAALLLLPGLTTAQSFGGQAAVAFVAWVASLAVLARRSAQGIYSGSVIYLVLFGLFHCGLLFSVAWRGEGSLNVVQRGWLNAGYTPAAARLAVLGMLAFTLASAAAGRAVRAAREPRRPAPASEPGLAFGAVGTAVQWLGLAMVLLALHGAGGLEVFSRGYVALFGAIDGYRLGWGILLFGFGTILGVVAGGAWRLSAWALFLLFSLAAVPLGARGVVMFPLAALVVVEARRGRRLRPLAAGGLVLGLLLLIAVVRSSRLGGARALLDASWAVSPLDAVAEMGSSLRPAVVVLGWHARGEPFRHGVTLVAVPLRVLERWTGGRAGPPSYDDRLMQAEILRRAGPIGGSPVAEGYHNFGTAGVIALLAVIGALVGALDALPSAPPAHALAGVVLVPLFTQVRNSASVVLPQILVGLALVALAWIVHRVPAFVARRSRSRQGAVAVLDR